VYPNPITKFSMVPREAMESAWLSGHAAPFPKSYITPSKVRRSSAERIAALDVNFGISGFKPASFARQRKQYLTTVLYRNCTRCFATYRPASMIFLIFVTPSDGVDRSPEAKIPEPVSGSYPYNTPLQHHPTAQYAYKKLMRCFAIVFSSSIYPNEAHTVVRCCVVKISTKKICFALRGSNSRQSPQLLSSRKKERSTMA
jgi:hypothetical protein